VFKILGKAARAKTCDAIMGITKEGAEIKTDYKGMPALDAGLLAAAQAVEHYEMSRYGTLRTWAEELGMPDAAALLEAAWPNAKLIRLAPPTAADALQLAAPRVAAGEFADVALLDGHYLRRSDAEIFGEPIPAAAAHP